MQSYRVPNKDRPVYVTSSSAIVAYLGYLLRRRVRNSRMLKPKTTSERIDELSS